MSNPNKRALFYAGLDMIDKSSGYGPLSEAKSPIGIIGGGLKRGTEKVKAEELSAANAASRSQSSNLANQLKLMEFQFKMDEPGAGEIALTKSLDKKLEFNSISLSNKLYFLSIILSSIFLVIF